ncbi:MAG: enoyl-CoA hydratase/isomerase family protein [Burkholderiales bacterium]|nr:enoyl-CoA hydratase/isomerase family protein [Burkholderiales bacterium]
MTTLEHDGLYRLQVGEGIACVTLNRPESMNAINYALRAELMELFPRMDTRDDVRVIVVTGAGDRAFCSGADLKERSEQTTDSMYRYRRHIQTRWAGLLANLAKPTIAAINGYCMGGGFEMALACDITIASERAVFALPEVTHGFIPGAGGTQRLARLIGVQKAKELILSGRRMNAAEALAIGAICRVVAHEALMAEANATARAIANNPSIAVMQAKLAINATQETGLSSGLVLETESWLSCMLSDTWKEKTRSFAKGERKP